MVFGFSQQAEKAGIQLLTYRVLSVIRQNNLEDKRPSQQT